MKKIPKLIIGAGLLMANTAFAHGPLPTPLIDVPTPEVPGLLDGASPIVVNKNMAIALGKALFWDTNVGSDGMACGSCHFHAGADARVKNQINPGGDKSNSSSPQTFDTLESGAGGPNHTLSLADFPLHAFNDPTSQESGVYHSTDDVIASAGTYSGTFKSVSQLSGSADACDRSADPVYHVGNTGTRRVEPRNAPTVINAVFNHRNFWDGRANNTFNGSSPWGERDPNAGVWVQTTPRTVEKQRLHLVNSSLASLSVAPPLSDSEMSCRGRNLAAIGRKLLSRQPLQYQNVHAQDSVFGPLNLTNSTTSSLKPSLRTTYKTMITKAFNSKYWAYGALGPFGTPGAGQLPYNQVEANFSMFFGIALQMYQSTLVSDQAPIDLTPRDAKLYPTWLGMGKTDTEIAQLKRGMEIFESNHCLICHSGPTMTAASVQTNATLVTPLSGKFYGPSHSRIAYGPQALGGPYPVNQALAAGISKYRNLVNRDNTTGGVMVHDLGFANTGVSEPSADIGLAGSDDFGNPLSFADQYVQYLVGNYSNVKDSGVNSTRVCDFIVALSYKVAFPLDGVFTENDGIEPDGIREQSLRNQGCKDSLTAYIPTVSTANTAFTANPGLLATAKQAAFKIPGLRNVELTGPYMHNGSMATLDQVLDFYTRHGNFENPTKNTNVTNIALLPNGNKQAALLRLQNNKADLLAFLKTFTDDRVRYEKAPFDHPEIKVPHGHVGNDVIATPGNPLNPALAKDEFLVVPAVGANGNTQPLLPFDQLLAH